jgi:hypothetical protein
MNHSVAIATKDRQISRRVCLDARLGGQAEVLNMVHLGETLSPGTVGFGETEIANLTTVPVDS